MCTISTLEDTTARLSEELEDANRKLHFIRTPERRGTARSNAAQQSASVERSPTKRKRPSFEEEDKAVNDKAVNDKAIEPATAALESDDEVPYRAKTARVVPRQLAYTGNAKPLDANRFASVLLQLSIEGKLDAVDLKTSTVPKGLGGKYMMINCLELAQKVITKEEHATLTNKKAEYDERLAAAHSVETKCVAKMAEYEGLDPKIESKNRRSRKKKRCLGLVDVSKCTRSGLLTLWD